MKHSFRTKITLFFLLGILLSMGALEILCNAFLKEIFIYDSKNSMIAYSEKIEQQLSDDKASIETSLNEIDIAHNIKTYVVNNSYDVLYSLKSDTSTVNTKRFELWINQFNKNKASGKGKDADYYWFLKNADERDNASRIIFVREADEEQFIVMTKAVRGIEQDIRIVSLFLFISGLLLAVFGTLIWRVATRPLTTQIANMSRITQKMSALDFEEKLHYNGKDEIGVLARSVNSMSDSLKESIDSLKTDVEKRKRILRDLSHEIKTPITTIKGYTENIQVVCPENQRVQKYCGIMLEECDEIDKLISEMLMMSQLESDEYECAMQEFDTDFLIRLIEGKIENEFSDCEILLDMEKAKLHVNANLVEKAVLNLVRNAVKYRTPDTPVVISGKTDGEYYTFSVTNDGKEISEREQQLIWEVFYKNDKSRSRNSSHGIGLSIVYRVAKIHGGDVGVKSDGGKNTFFMTLKMK